MDGARAKAIAAHGLALLLRNQFEECQAYLKDHETVDGQRRPRLASLYALTGFVKGVATFGKAELDESLRQMWHAEFVGKQAKTVEGRLVQAETHLLGAIIQILQESYLKAAINLKKSKSLYDQVWEALGEYVGDDKDDLWSGAQFGVGIFNLFLSILPPTVVFVAGLFGFEGDRDQGLALLDEAQRGGHLFSPIAALCLLVYFVSIALHIGSQTAEDLARAEELLNWADERLPNSFFFLYFRSRLHRSRAEMTHATLSLEVAMDRVCGIAAFRQLIAYELAWCHFIQLQFPKAADNLYRILNDPEAITKSSNMRAFYAYHRGLCLFCNDDIAEAMQSFRRVPDLISGKLRPLDKYCLRKAKQFADGTGSVLDAFELLQVWNALASIPPEVVDSAIALLDASNAKQGFAGVDALRYHAYRGFIFSKIGGDEKAEAEYASVLTDHGATMDQRGQQDGVMPLAWASYALWKIQAGDWESAKVAHGRAASYSGYDLQKMVSFRLYSIGQTISNAARIRSS